MKENWIDDMKRKLEGHKMAPPPGLWEDISKQMDKPFGLKPLSRLTGTAQRYWAAAAAVLALVGFFVFHENSNDIDQPQQVNAVSLQPASPQVEKMSPVKNEASTATSVLALAQTSIPYHAAKQVELAEPAKQEEVVVESVEQPEPESVFPEFATQEVQEIAAESSPTSSRQRKEQQELSEHPQRQTRRDKQNGSQWSIGINASGGLLAANTSQRVDRLYNYSMSNIGEKGYSDDLESNHSSYAYTLTEYRSKHHLPIRFGVSLNYQLNNYLALHSGISYTRLNSEFSIPLYQNISYNQKLHYLGVPLGVTWQLWASHRFRFYLSGGMMLEKCVSADLEGDGKVTKKPWQWSVDAAAGAEYVLTRQLGFYLEPSLGYYFDDGTSLEHYYKEHPLAPSIEFGLRLHLK